MWRDSRSETAGFVTDEAIVTFAVGQPWAKRNVRRKQAAFASPTRKKNLAHKSEHVVELLVSISFLIGLL